ncbi:cobalamin biosynthesis protein CobQ [Algirhabdus cladophorae]|uniref:cobalamin biosynthesis protein CobQ n=1 Tax=Algirhabdus cladophorae TaxID=3377108 RepID=UPI003B84651B
MNTPAHLIFGLAAFSKKHQMETIFGALIGAMLPDVSLYLMAGVSIFLLDISPQIVFRDLYFSPQWQQVFAVDNSFILWGIGFAFALWGRVPWAIALTGAALLHIALDFPLHMEDARAHFWPLTDWKFISPVSYWDNNHHGALIGGIEMALCAAMAIILWRRFTEIWVRASVAVLMTLELAPVFFWAFMMTDL